MLKDVTKKKFKLQPVYNHDKNYSKNQKNKKLIGIDALKDSTKIMYKSMKSAMSIKLDEEKEVDEEDEEKQQQKSAFSVPDFSVNNLKKNFKAVTKPPDFT